MQQLWKHGTNKNKPGSKWKCRWSGQNTAAKSTNSSRRRRRWPPASQCSGFSNCFHSSEVCHDEAAPVNQLGNFPSTSKPFRQALQLSIQLFPWFAKPSKQLLPLPLIQLRIQDQFKPQQLPTLLQLSVPPQVSKNWPMHGWHHQGWLQAQVHPWGPNLNL